MSLISARRLEPTRERAAIQSRAANQQLISARQNLSVDLHIRTSIFTNFNVETEIVAPRQQGCSTAVEFQNHRALNGAMLR